MYSILQQISSDIAQVRDEITLHDVLVSALQTRYSNEPQKLKTYVIATRRLVYRGVIIGLYGLFEQTIDSIIIETVENYQRVYSTLNDVPETVRNSQRENLLNCMKEGHKARVRRPIGDAEALASLGASHPSAPIFVPSAFTYGGSNYRIEEVKRLFAKLDIEIEVDRSGGRIVREETNFADVSSFLKDLVQRRNDMAHSYTEDDLLPPESLLAYSRIVEYILVDIIDQATSSILLKILNNKGMVLLGEVEEIWSKRIGFRMNNGQVSVGDNIVIVKKRASIFTVDTIEVNRKKTNHVNGSAGAPTEVCVGVNRETKDSLKAGSVYYLPPDWASLRTFS